MKIFKKTLFAALLLCASLCIAAFAAACQKTIDYSVVVTCSDLNVLSTVKVKLVDENGEDATEEQELDELGMALIKAPVGNYNVVVVGVEDEYSYPETTVSEENPYAKITLKKIAKTDYYVTVKMPEGNPIGDLEVQLVSNTGKSYKATTSQIGRASFIQIPVANYKIVIDEDQDNFPEGYEPDNKALVANDKTFGIFMTPKAITPPAILNGTFSGSNYTLVINGSKVDLTISGVLLPGKMVDYNETTGVIGVYMLNRDQIFQFTYNAQNDTISSGEDIILERIS